MCFWQWHSDCLATSPLSVTWGYWQHHHHGMPWALKDTLTLAPWGWTFLLLLLPLFPISNVKIKWEVMYSFIQNPHLDVLCAALHQVLETKSWTKHIWTWRQRGGRPSCCRTLPPNALGRLGQSGSYVTWSSEVSDGLWIGRVDNHTPSSPTEVSTSPKGLQLFGPCQVTGSVTHAPLVLSFLSSFPAPQ